jgi:hypothetical protein
MSARHMVDSGLALLLLCALFLVAPPPPAVAADCRVGGSANGDDLYLQSTCFDASTNQDGAEVQEVNQLPLQLTEYRWSALCAQTDAEPDNPRASDQCGLVRACTDGEGVMAMLWSRQLQREGNEYVPIGDWSALGTECITFDPDDPPTDVASPRITWQMVLNEIRRVGLPALAIRVQPADRTLVNFETIFYTEPEPFERRLTLLGQRVDVRATATTFAWSFGDGEMLETATAGAPYPAKDVVHEYADADVTVAPKVDVTYTARFRVNGGPWQEIPQTVTIGGPPTSLDVLEATPVLVGPG